jgi:hypothetical protein
MTQPNRHRIQRQVVELAIGDGLSGPAVQESFARSFHDEIVPEIVAVFDRAAGARQLLRLERLEVDLGRIESNDWQPELRRRLGVELAQWLARYQPEATADARPATDGQTGEPLRPFLYFLEHGRIPWWGTRPEAGWSASLSGVRLDGLPLRAILQTDPHARLRFVDSLDDDLLEHAVAGWCGVPHSVLAFEMFARRAMPMQARAVWRRRFWSHLLEAAVEPGVLPARGPELVREVLDGVHAADPELAVKPPTPARVTPTEIGDPTPEALVNELPSPWREWLASARHLETVRDPRLEPVIQKAADGRRVSPAKLRAGRDMRAPLKPLDEDEIYLPGAGAILLHPFLESLFRDRGLLEARDFRDADARGRAVHLVGLLTFGCRGIPEYDHVAAKLLCGHPLDEPIAPAALDDADVVACEELLAAVLKHWSALRCSSADWLRAQFFLRDGKLEKVDEGFRLTVERRAQDVLLARLPWGIGVIGFPWMKEKVFVRWLD